MEDVQVDDHNLRFVTHSIETVNTQERELTHSYVAELDGENLRMRLHITGGHSSNPPLEFTAVRVAVN